MPRQRIGQTLAAVIGHSGTMTLATAVSVPVIRGPVPLAKTLTAIDRLSQGRLVVAGPGSSQADFDSVGVDFAERWARLDESIGSLRALWRAGATPFVGRGTESVEDGSREVVRVVLLGPKGPTGTFTR